MEDTEKRYKIEKIEEINNTISNEKSNLRNQEIGAGVFALNTLTFMINGFVYGNPITFVLGIASGVIATLNIIDATEKKTNLQDLINVRDNLINENKETDLKRGGR